MSDWFDGAGSGGRIDVMALLDSDSFSRLVAMVDLGALVSLSLTSDGGALGVTVTVDGRWRREYFRDADQLALWTEEAMVPVKQACEGRIASRAPRQRERSPRGR